MSNKIYPSIATLPMEDIAKYLNIVTGFRKKEEFASDTYRVDGVDAEKIAIAALDEQGNLIADRKTVENALKLGGIDASEFITIENSEALLLDTHKVSTTNADEIRNLRDELYQIKNELAKNGLIKDKYSYFGYQDPFREGEIKYVSEIITRGAQIETRPTISDITVVDATDIEVGEYIVVNNAGKEYITKVTRKEDNRLFISPTITGPFDAIATIRKTLGIYHNGSFLFGEKYGELITDKEKYIMLNDDTNTFALPRLNKADHGFGVLFKVPESAKGAIKKFSIMARAFGAPGNLKCYIVDPSIDDGKNIFDMQNLEQMREEGKIVGESDVITIAQSTGIFREMDFVFKNPAIVEGRQYVAIVKCLDADESNYWELQGLRKAGGGDLQTNMRLFMYREEVDNTALKIEIDDADMYFTLTVNEVATNNIGYLQKGLYTAKLELPQNETASRIRVELKVNREGRFAVVDNPASMVVDKNESISLTNKDNKQYSGSIFSSDTTIVIGDQISKVGNSRLSNTYFSLAEATYTKPSADVYRVGYEVVLKARNKVLDLTNRNNPISYKDTTIMEIPFKAVIPGKESGREDRSSDRLIFETEILSNEDEKTLAHFNDFEIQIFWASTGVTPAEMYANPELSGSIYDIVISADKAYSKKR